MTVKTDTVATVTMAVVTATTEAVTTIFVTVSTEAASIKTETFLEATAVGRFVAQRYIYIYNITACIPIAFGITWVV